MPRSPGDLWDIFVGLWPQSLQPYVVLILVLVLAAGLVATTLNSILDLLKRGRQKHAPIAAVERYRGLLIAKFRTAIDAVDADIERLQERKEGFFGLDGKEAVAYDVKSLVEFRCEILETQRAVFEHLDKQDIVSAHQELSRMREIAGRLRSEAQEFQEGYERAATMSIVAMERYGRLARLWQRRLHAIAGLEEISDSEPPRAVDVAGDA